jgi:hypothetical protein
LNSDELVADLFANSFKQTVQNIIPNCNAPLLNQDIYRKLIEKSILVKKATSRDVYKIIMNTNSNKAPGIDGVRTVDLKLVVAEKISTAIAHLINSSITCGLFPDELKIGLVRPIYKNGIISNCSNYRPITMLPSLDKIVEKYVSSQIHTFYKTHNVSKCKSIRILA